MSKRVTRKMRGGFRIQRMAKDVQLFIFTLSFHNCLNYIKPAFLPKQSDECVINEAISFKREVQSAGKQLKKSWYKPSHLVIW